MIQVLIGPGLLAVTVITTLAPAAKDPDEGETLSSCADRTVIWKCWIGPPLAVSVNVPVAVPPEATRVTVVGDIVKTPSPAPFEDDEVAGEDAGACDTLPGELVVPVPEVPAGATVAPALPVGSGPVSAVGVVSGPGAATTPEADGASPIPPPERREPGEEDAPTAAGPTPPPGPADDGPWW